MNKSITGKKMEGYKVTIEKELSKKEYTLTYLDSKEAIKKDLRSTGFTFYEIMKAKFVALSPKELEDELAAIEEF